MLPSMTFILQIPALDGPLPLARLTRKPQLSTRSLAEIHIGTSTPAETEMLRIRGTALLSKTAMSLPEDLASLLVSDLPLLPMITTSSTGSHFTRQQSLLELDPRKPARNTTNPSAPRCACPTPALPVNATFHHLKIMTDGLVSATTVGMSPTEASFLPRPVQQQALPLLWEPPTTSRIVKRNGTATGTPRPSESESAEKHKMNVTGRIALMSAGRGNLKAVATPLHQRRLHLPHLPLSLLQLLLLITHPF